MRLSKKLFDLIDALPDEAMEELNQTLEYMVDFYCNSPTIKVTEPVTKTYKVGKLASSVRNPIIISEN